MADGVFNISKGRVVEFYNRIESNDPTNAAFIIVLLKANETETALLDHDNLSLLLAATGNTEADFTSYARKTLTDTELAALPAPDDSSDRYDIDIPDQTWSPAGGATNNTLTKFLVCYDSDTTGGTDTNILPVTHHDFAVTTDGSDLTAQINAAGFFRAA
jgi:hypothetical protein